MWQRFSAAQLTDRGPQVTDQQPIGSMNVLPQIKIREGMPQLSFCNRKVAKTKAKPSYYPPECNMPSFKIYPI